MSSKKTSTSPPITKYFNRLPIKENSMTFKLQTEKRNRQGRRLPDYPIVMFGPLTRQPLTNIISTKQSKTSAQSSPIVLRSRSPSPEPYETINEENNLSASNDLVSVNEAINLKKTITNMELDDFEFSSPCNTAIVNKIHGVMELDESKLPSWLQDPHSSSSSDDEDLVSVGFLNKPNNVKVEDEMKNNVPKPLSKLLPIAVPVEVKPSVLTPLANDLQHMNMGLSPPPISPAFPLPSAANQEFLPNSHLLKSVTTSLSLGGVADPVLFEDSMDVPGKLPEDNSMDNTMKITTVKFEFEMCPPFLNDLEMLIITCGTISLVDYKEDKMSLFSEGQQEMVDVFLMQDFISLPERLYTIYEYLMMITTRQCMINAGTLEKIWRIITSNDSNLGKVIGVLMVRYFSYLFSLHPPHQHQYVRQQYCQFIDNISPSLLDLLSSQEEWKIELLSIIVNIMTSDYWSLHKDNSTPSLSPLFHSLFWKSNEIHSINQTIRHFLQSTIDVFKQPLTTNINQTLKINTCLQLLFLIYTVTEEVGSELIHLIPSLPFPQCFILLGSLLPIKLQDFVVNNCNLDISPDQYKRYICLYTLFNKV